ncbi:hypothetical protein WA158_005433 [Blastocystis sp. Blastoise]
MPKSKRSRVVSLTKTDKKGKELKDDLVNKIRAAVDEYSSVYVFDFFNMRSNAFKELRAQFADSRFFLGKNRVMSFALGKTTAEEYRDNIHELAPFLNGNATLFMTNRSEEEVLKFFSEYHIQDYARSGFISTQKFVIPEGPMPFAHSMLEEFKKLKLPVILKDGVLTLTKEYLVCEEGKILNPEQCRLLKFYMIPMASFHLEPIALWKDNQVKIYKKDN